MTKHVYAQWKFEQTCRNIHVLQNAISIAKYYSLYRSLKRNYHRWHGNHWVLPSGCLRPWHVIAHSELSPFLLIIVVLDELQPAEFLGLMGEIR